ncbi:hypothetical protein ABPG77_001248 [Micractinium sp. CCAP 211/92]
MTVRTDEWEAAAAERLATDGPLTQAQQDRLEEATAGMLSGFSGEAVPVDNPEVQQIAGLQGAELRDLRSSVRQLAAGQTLVENIRQEMGYLPEPGLGRRLWQLWHGGLLLLLVGRGRQQIYSAALRSELAWQQTWMLASLASAIAIAAGVGLKTVGIGVALLFGVAIAIEAYASWRAGRS